VSLCDNAKKKPSAAKAGWIVRALTAWRKPCAPDATWNWQRKNPQNCHPNFVRILNELRNLIAPWHFTKSRSLASLGMTTNYGCSANWEVVRS